VQSGLSVRPAADAAPGVDFAYAIHNADGGEVEHCGNGARCFLAFVRAQGLTDQRTVTILETMNRVLRLYYADDDRVNTVDMERTGVCGTRFP
jgi:diaminopimelate epimerase